MEFGGGPQRVSEAGPSCPPSGFWLQPSRDVGPAAPSLGKEAGLGRRPGAFPMPDLQQALHSWFGEINDMLIT